MSAATANVFALLDDEGTVDAGQLAAKLPVASKETITKTEDKSTTGKCWVVDSLSHTWCHVWEDDTGRIY